MGRGIQGDYILSATMPETFLAFVPRPLPPVPPLQLDGNLYDLIERANRALGRLDGLTTPMTQLRGHPVLLSMGASSWRF
jgi:hypothetical protein